MGDDILKEKQIALVREESIDIILLNCSGRSSGVQQIRDRDTSLFVGSLNNCEGVARILKNSRLKDLCQATALDQVAIGQLHLVSDLDQRFPKISIGCLKTDFRLNDSALIAVEDRKRDGKRQQILLRVIRSRGPLHCETRTQTRIWKPIRPRQLQVRFPLRHRQTLSPNIGTILECELFEGPRIRLNSVILQLGCEL